jgi:hypothetical protein
VSRKRYSKTNPAPKRCATCKFAVPAREECTAPTPAWVRIAQEEEGDCRGPWIDLADHRDPKCPLWQARPPTVN